MGCGNFCALDECFSGYDKSDVVVVPAPVELSSTYGCGSKYGPKAIIDASGNMELYDEECGVNPCEDGIHTFDDVRGEDALKAVERVVKKVLADGKFPVVLGGEHSVSLGAIRACAGKYRRFSLLHIDAHADLRDEYRGSKFNHACVMRRGFEVSGHVVAVGIRSMCEEEKEFIDDKRMQVFYAKDMVKDREWVSKAVESLRDNVYVTIDADALDPSVMPATGTPEPGGLSYYDVISLLREAAKKRNIVGLDVVEVAPIENLVFPQYTAAKIVYKMLAYRKFYGKCTKKQ